MKNFYIIILMLVTITSTSQTVFSNAFAGELPTQLQMVNDDLYVGTFNGSKIYQLDTNNPSSIDVVYDYSTVSNIWKMGYDGIDNKLYCYNFINISSFDLSQTLPISPSNVINVNDSNGFDINNGVMYIGVGGDLFTYEINVGASSYQIIYSDADGDIRNPRVYNNELYYALGSPSNNLYKIDLSSQNPQRMLVSTNLNLVQASLLVNNYLYLGTELTNKLLRIDLSESNLPITPVILADNLTGAILGLANKGTTIYATDGTSQNINTFQDPALSITDTTKKEISVYPNPAKDFLYIYDNQIYNVSFKIYSLDGTILKKGACDDGAIDVSNFNQGLYFISLYTDDRTITQKFLKK